MALTVNNYVLAHDGSSDSCHVANCEKAAHLLLNLLTAAAITDWPLLCLHVTLEVLHVYVLVLRLILMFVS